MIRINPNSDLCPCESGSLVRECCLGPEISLPQGPSVTGHSKVSRVYFDGILPSIIAAQYVEMLQAQ
jgi:hypothetical protein